MYKFTILLVSALLPFFLFAQEDPNKKKEVLEGANDLKKEKAHGSDSTGWKVGGTGTLNFSQVQLKNWAAGGQNSISILGVVQLFADYKKNKFAWDNRLGLSYGMLKNAKTPFVKSDDKIDLLSKAGLEAFHKDFLYSALFSFKSQMTPTFDANQTFVSGFMTPAFSVLGIGIEYKPTNYFSAFLAPITGKATFVRDQDLANTGAFGVEAGEFDSLAGQWKTLGKTSRYELGAYFIAMFNKEVIKNVTINTKLELFNNYTDHNKSNRKNIDVSWETVINFKVNKFLSASLFTHLLYDNDIKIIVDDNTDGIPEGFGPRLQFKEVFGIGLSYKF